MELPLSKVKVPVLKVTATIGERETGVAFKARNYNTSEHHVCSTQLQHGCLNRVFVLAGRSYQPCPEPNAHMVKKC
jgi:hypothetical protein